MANGWPTLAMRLGEASSEEASFTPEPTVPFTARPPAHLKSDHNYSFMRTDAEVDAEARTSGHGHVRPREDGRKAKCGGPGGPCGPCRREEELVAAGVLS